MPAVATGFVEPTLGLNTIGVREHPDAIEVAIALVGEPRRWVGDLAAEAELLDCTRAAMRADDGEHQRVPVDPWSAIG